MKSYVFTFAVTLLWLATSVFLATTVHADKKVGVSYADYGSPKESNFMLASDEENGDAKAEEARRMLKKVKKSNKKTKAPTRKPIKKPSRRPSMEPSQHPSMMPSQHPSNYPSHAPSPVLLNTVVRGPTTHRAGSQVCNVVDEDGVTNRYNYCMLLNGVSDETCQSTNAVGGPFWFNRDTGGQDVTFNFERVDLLVDTEDAVCIKINTDSAGSTKGFFEFWDDVDEYLSSLTSFSFQWRVKSCPTGFSWSASCLNRLFFQVYTRSTLGSVLYCDCRYTLYLSQGSSLPSPPNLNEWYTFTFDPSDVLTAPSITPSKCTGASVASCPPYSTAAAPSPSPYVLGTNNRCGDRYSYAMNLGQGAGDDGGLEVCFKNVQYVTTSKSISYTFQKVP
jgi:hypothetical protein